MGLFDHFPYTNVHELNLDWILSIMKVLEAEWEAFTAGNSLQFADPMLHDISKTYAKNTIVLDGIGNAYVSLQAVPVGVGLQNGDYWLMVFDYEAFIEKVNKNFTARYYRGSYRATAAMAIGDWLTVDDVLYKATAAIAVDDVMKDGVNITHFTLEDFIKAFMQSANQRIQQYKNDIDASELLYRQQLAQDIANTTASLQSQLDIAISGATADSEVINARVGWDNTTYNTLREAIVGQILECIHSYPYIPDNTDYPDLNNVPSNSILQYGTLQGVSNAPTNARTSFVITFNPAVAAYGAIQIVYCRNLRTIFYRWKWSGTWTEWTECITPASLQNYFDNTLEPLIKDDIIEIHNTLQLERKINAFDYRTDGSYIQADNVTLGANANYSITDLMPVNEGECWVFDGKQRAAGVSTIVGYSDYDATDPTVLLAGGITGRHIIFIPSGIKVIRAQAENSFDMNLIHEHNTIFYDSSSLESFRDFITNHTSNAHFGNEITIKIFDGTYNVDSDFTAEEIADEHFIGVIIPDFVNIEGAGMPENVILQCSTASNKISTLNPSTYNKIKNITVIGNGCRYAIHDDFNVADSGDIRVIENCIIKSNNCTYSFAYGGGCKSGQRYLFKNTKFISMTNSDKGFEMHSNTDFTSPTTIELENCECIATGTLTNGFELRALGDTAIINHCILNNNKISGYHLVVDSIVDWDITGAGNSQSVPVLSDDPTFTLSFSDKPATSTENDLSSANVGVFRFKDGIPQWWNGTNWVDASGNVI